MTSIFPNSRVTYDEMIVRRASHFTAVRFLGKGQYERIEFDTLRKAIALVLAAADPNGWMVYAVASQSQDAHLSQALWQRSLEVRGEVRGAEAGPPA